MLVKLLYSLPKRSPDHALGTMWAMKLFDDIDRKYHGPARFAVSEFSFLNSSARPLYQDIRNLLERWFEDYPASGKEELRSQFRSNRNSQHWGAFFELYCYTILCYQGFEVELHPSGAAGKTTRPDFLVSRNGEKLFYMECTLAADSVFNDAAQKRLDEVIDSLNERLELTDFFISVEVKDAPPQSPSIRRMRSFLEERLCKLNPDEVTEVMRTRGLEDYDRWVYTDAEWEVVFSPVPIAPEFRGQPGTRPIGEVLYDDGEINPERPLVNALNKKAGRYGVLDLPYVIAVDAMDVYTEESDVGDALFGRKLAQFNKQTREVSYVYSGSNALWRGPNGPTYTRVSGVLVARRLKAATVTDANTPALWHNPWSSKPLNPELWQGPQKVPDPATSTMKDRGGRNFPEILRLTL